MNTKLISALLVAVSAAVAAPAFASGYGPAPFYRPEAGAPASQRGVSAQTLAAEQGAVIANDSGVGGSEAGAVGTGSSVSDSNLRALYRGVR